MRLTPFPHVTATRVVVMATPSLASHLLQDRDDSLETAVVYWLNSNSLQRYANAI